MTKDEAIKMAKAKLECLERETSGLWENCNNDCENCDLNYDQGNMGEQKEWLKFAIKTMEQGPVYFPPCVDCNTKMNEIREAYDKLKNQESCEDAVSRQAALGALNCEISGRIESDIDLCKYKREFQEFANMILKAQEKAIQALPSVTHTHSGWIPVGERPPEDGEKILMSTVHFGEITGVYDGELGFMTHYSLSSADMASVEVIEWMPLPESYEAETESEN